MADNTPKQQQQDNKYANLRQVLNTQLPGNGPVVVKCRCGAFFLFLSRLNPIKLTLYFILGYFRLIISFINI
jgi:hypothetical protein